MKIINLQQNKKIKLNNHIRKNKIISCKMINNNRLTMINFNKLIKIKKQWIKRIIKSVRITKSNKKKKLRQNLINLKRTSKLKNNNNRYLLKMKIKIKKIKAKVKLKTQKVKIKIQ
jgi:hypothetical protein